MMRIVHHINKPNHAMVRELYWNFLCNIVRSHLWRF